MNFPRIKILFLLAICSPLAVIAAETELDTLNNLDNSTPGVLFTGEFRSGVLTSILDSVKNTDIGANTEADIEIQARPTAETRATAVFRIHQDWQKAHEEPISPVLLNWLSFDGKAFGGFADFNLGDMSIAYTPLTIYTPILDFSNESDILADRRKDVMSYKHLANNGTRLLQGLNFALHSGAVSVFDNLYLQGTFSRLRTQPRKYDLVFYDYDDTDRLLFAGRAGLDLLGISLGANYVYSFTREGSLKNLENPVSTDPDFSIGSTKPFLIEDNTVFSGTLGLDIARLLNLNDWKIDLGAEYATSNYRTANFYSERKSIPRYVMDISIVENNGKVDTIKVLRIKQEQENSPSNFHVEELDELSGSAILATLNALAPASLAKASLEFKFIKNDKNFVSELSQSPIYYTPSVVLNASAVDAIRSGTLENIYFAKYTADPLTQINITGDPDERDLLNNNKKGHFLRSGYVNTLLTPAELRNVSVQEFDPGVNLSLPFGLATPNRQGFLLKAEWLGLGDALSVNAFANMVKQSDAEGDLSASSFLDAGGGLSIEIGKLAGLSQKIKLNGGYGLSKETDGYERSVNRVSAGLNVGIFKWLSIRGGLEMANKDYGISFAEVLPNESVTGDELLWLAGPEFELSRGAYFNVQYGMLNYKYKVGDASADLNRNLISADVRVKF